MLKVGIIGTGLIAREHAQAILALPRELSLVAATDADADALDAFVATSGVRHKYPTPAQLIGAEVIDLVVVATPPSTHAGFATSALDAGKYVFCEKPLAQSLVEATRIVDAEARHPGRLATSYQMRFDASVRRLLWLCQSGWIGDIQSAAVERHSYIPHAEGRKGNWWGSWNVAGGGVLITQLIHELDLLLQVMGRPVSVSARMDTRYTNIESEDFVDATFEFAGGRSARCVASVNSGHRGGRVSIQGSLGTVSLPWNVTIADARQRATALRELDRALPDTRPPSTSFLARGARMLARRAGLKNGIALTPHARMYAAIARSIERGKPLPVGPAEAIASLEMCAGAYEAALSGKASAFPVGVTRATFGGVSPESYAFRLALHAGREPAVRRMKTELIRIGLVGLDTSHATTFAKILHDPSDPFHIPGAKVVAAYPGGSRDMEISISRVSGFTSELRNRYGILIVESPEAVAAESDILLVLAADGRTHPAIVSAVVRYGKPIFVDKPFAVSVGAAEEMLSIATANGARLFASSAFRYADGLVKALRSLRENNEEIRACNIHCWLPIQETQGRYFWYGIHGAEMLMTCMRSGAREVSAAGDEEKDVISIRHNDGRESRIIGSRSDGAFKVCLETEKRKIDIDLSASMPSLSSRLLWSVLDVLAGDTYPRLWVATKEGSVGGNRPGRDFDPAPTDALEIVRLLEAAQRSYSSRQAVML